MAFMSRVVLLALIAVMAQGASSTPFGFGFGQGANPYNLNFPSHAQITANIQNQIAETQRNIQEQIRRQQKQAQEQQDAIANSIQNAGPGDGNFIGTSSNVNYRMVRDEDGNLVRKGFATITTNVNGVVTTKEVAIDN